MNRNTENFLLIGFLGLSIFTVLAVKILFANTPERWEYGHETGEILYNLSLAYIASAIFYFIVVIIPTCRNRKNINEQARRIVDGMTYSGLGMLAGLSTNLEREKILTRDEFMDVCNKIGPESMKDLFMTSEEQYPISYIRHLTSLREYVKTNSNNLFVYISHLDTELIKLVNDILNCQFMTNLDPYFADEQYRHPTFENVSHAFYDFYQLMQQLKNYRETRM